MGEGTVLLRRSSLGDVVLLGAVTAAVPRPVTVVTDARYVALAARLRGVAEALPWGASVEGRGRVIDLQGSLRSWRAYRADARIHKRSLRRRAWLWWGVGAGRPAVPSLYGEACGVVPRAPAWFDLPRHPRDTLALVPGAAWAPKRPHMDRLIASGKAWNGPVVVLGGPAEEGLVQELVQALPDAEVVVESGFSATLSALARTRVCVAGDTGLMHLAGACGATVVALFGPTHPDDGFFVYPGEVVQRSLPCRPCALHRVPVCRQGDHLCMDLPVDDVVAAVRRCAGSS